MAIQKFISAVVFAAATVLLHQTTRVDASCICPAVFFTPSDYADMGAVVLRATVLSRSAEPDANDDVTYTVKPTTIYAGGPDVDNSKRIYFTTAASPGDCGINPELGGDYLLSLFRRGSVGLTVGACDLNMPWGSVSDEWMEELDDLLEGGDDDDYYKK